MIDKKASGIKYVGVSFCLFSLFLGLIFLSHADAATLTQTTVDNRNDFVLEPAKQEVSVDPGQSAVRYITVTSRITTPTAFQVENEDITGSNNPDQPVILLGNDKSPYSLKDSLHPDTTNFTLNFGQKIQIPVTIDLPSSTSPGGYYAAVIVSNAPSKEATSSQETGTKAISRIASLFFVRVNGPVNQSGKLTDFKIKDNQAIYQKADMTFQIYFQNTGSIYLVPYGTIDIKNLWGETIDQLPVDAYFSLPDSLRYREISWSKSAAFGRYTATINLNPGFGSTTESRTISFWIIPYKILLLALLIIIVLVGLTYFIFRNFEFKRKK